MDIKKILIVGFGRMGLTHYSILNMLLPEAEFHVIETNRKIERLFKKNFPKIMFYTNEEALPIISFDLTLITTPPFIHANLVEKAIIRKDKIIFVEKPFGGFMNNAFHLEGPVFVGYVLRFNPCIQWIKSNIDATSITKISGSYFSNTIESKPKGWRNGNYSGVLNEMGSHILDIINFIITLDNVTVIHSEIKSKYSDTDDIVNAKLLSGDTEVEINLDWVNKNYRKPEFQLELLLNTGERYVVDQQKITEYSGDTVVTVVSVASIKTNVPYYLRGVDFTLQMEQLVSNQENLCNLENALVVNSTIKKLLSV